MPKFEHKKMYTGNVPLQIFILRFIAPPHTCISKYATAELQWHGRCTMTFVVSEEND